MAYEEQTWADDEAGGTPITAERLKHIEDGVKSNSAAPAWRDITDKPITFPAADHDHPLSGVRGLQEALDAKASTEDLEAIELTPGPAGPKGDAGAAGAAGAKGDKGDAGAAGAPSQTDWDALVARVAALEAPSA